MKLEVRTDAFSLVLVQGNERLHDLIEFLVPERQKGWKEKVGPLIALAVFEERPEAEKLPPVIIGVSPEIDKETPILVPPILDVPL